MARHGKHLISGAAGAEAAFKYFLLGAFSSAFFLYGIAFAFALSGSTRLDLDLRCLPRRWHRFRSRRHGALETGGLDRHRRDEPYPRFGTVSTNRGLAASSAVDEMTVPGPSGALMTLHYRGVSIWRRDTDGVWRCVVDIANEPAATTVSDKEKGRAAPAAATAAPAAQAFDTCRS